MHIKDPSDQPEPGPTLVWFDRRNAELTERVRAYRRQRATYEALRPRSEMRKHSWWFFTEQHVILMGLLCLTGLFLVGMNDRSVVGYFFVGFGVIGLAAIEGAHDWRYRRLNRLLHNFRPEIVQKFPNEVMFSDDYAFLELHAALNDLGLRNILAEASLYGTTHNMASYHLNNDVVEYLETTQKYRALLNQVDDGRDRDRLDVEEARQRTTTEAQAYASKIGLQVNIARRNQPPTEED